MSGASPRGDKARVTVQVPVPPKVAFEVFTGEIDLWWRRGPRFRFSGRSPGVLHFEPRLGGRLFESFGEGPEVRVFEAGRIRVLEPPARLVFEWRNLKFKPGETTEVEVRFEANASGTAVTVEHRGWATLPAEHPARHGLAGGEFSRQLGLWWGALGAAFREHLSAGR